MEQSESEFIQHIPCDNCGSSDACGIYTDGHTFCFSCNTHKHGTEEEKPVKTNTNTDTDFLRGEVQALAKRKLTEETTKLWDYRVGEFNGSIAQVANHKNNQGQTVAQKIRLPNKEFFVKGNMKEATLYGQWLWRDGGKMVTVTEGELDALSLSQAMGNKWPVVSVKTGAAGAKREIAKAVEYLESFDSVIFMFDNDEVGQQAAIECASLLSPNKAKIARLPLKDASDMLQQGRSKELVDAMWGAKSYRPDGIINGADLWETVSTVEEVESVPYPFDGLNAMTDGCRKGEIVTVTAGSGLGKSQLTREFAYKMLNDGSTIGYVALEESAKRTAQGLMSLHLNRPVHLTETPEAELREAFDATLGTGRVFMYDHWGSTESDNLLGKIRYLARGCNCDYIVLDHISIVVSGIDDGDERRIIDNLMTKLRSLVEELDIGMILVSHLKRPNGEKGHEEGAKTSLAQLRGSAAIAQLSDMVIGLERNQQATENAHVTTVRVLKNRWSGVTGISCKLSYDTDTGRMNEVFDEEDIPFDEEF